MLFSWKEDDNMLNDNAVVDALRQQKQTGGRAKIYKQLSDEHRGERLAVDISRKTAALRDAIRQDRIDWDDLEGIQRRVLRYLEDCQAAQSIPTVSGLAAFGLGISRQSLNLYLQTHADTATAKFLQQVKDAFADLLEISALSNTINPVMTIFIMKNDYDRADRVQIEPVSAPDPLGERLDAERLAAQLDALPDD